ncbi:bola-like protein [Tricholoma matsutake]|nr:bola-like protein [Tricholoma matsutake 945]
MPVNITDIETAIKEALPVSYLEVNDQSNGCGESYSIVVVSEAFEGKSILARHRQVNEILKAEIAKMHAFSQKALTPKQFEAQKLANKPC